MSSQENDVKKMNSLDDSFQKNLLNKNEKSAEDAEEMEDELKENHNNEFDTRIETLVELQQDVLKPFTLSDCYATDRPGMQLEILPKIIFDTVDEDISEDKIDLPKPIFRQTVDHGTQASVKYRSNKAQTLRRKLVNSWCQYEPRVFSEEEKEEYLVADSFSTFLSAAENRIMNSLTQNSIADIFVREIDLLHHDSVASEERESEIKISGSFSCSEDKELPRMISSIDWHALYKDIFVASTMKFLPFEERILKLIETKGQLVPHFIWSAKNQFSPKLRLSSFHDICILKFNPTIPDILVGGTFIGQLALWDIKNVLVAEKKIGLASTEVISCCAVSNIDCIHAYGITCIQWVPLHFEVYPKGFVHKNSSSLSFQVATCGLDGTLQFWDLRMGFPFKTSLTAPKKYSSLDGVWEPFHSMQVMSTDGRIKKSLNCFAFRENVVKEEEKELIESEISKRESSVLDEKYADFYAGCDDGDILCGNFKLVKDDVGKFVAKIPEFYLSPHDGPISAITTSPFICDIFLSTGGKIVAIWTHEIKVKPVILRMRDSVITCTQWSPTRPALFVLGFQNGVIEIWDLLNDIYEPFVIHYISTSAIKCVSIQIITDLEHIIAVGDFNGVVYTVTLPQNLRNSAENELSQMTEFFQIEIKRIQEEISSSSETTTAFEAEQKKSFDQLIENNEDENEKMENAYKNFLRFQEEQLKILHTEQMAEEPSE